MPRGSGNSFTGANAIPLGPRNPAIGAKRTFSATPPTEKPPSLLNPPRPPEPPPQFSQMPGMGSVSSKAAEALRAAQAAAASLAAKKFGDKLPPVQPPQPPPMSNSTSDERGRPRKKRSRWGAVDAKIDIPGIPSSMPANLSQEQQRAYILQLQIEDLTRKLKSGDLGISPNPEDRSPSPEPIYNNEGKRLNTREYRTRKKMEEDRHKLIQDMLGINENYKPPMDYKPPVQRISEQIMIPADLNPSINFVGLLIGPRGNTLKKIEKESNCKIMIRGKGSVKEGKIGRKDGMPLPGEDEPLHALITGTKIEDVQTATQEINRIIKQGIEQPEGQNDLRKLQLMELARLNGTLRDENMPREREWLKPENQNVTNTTVCTKCGGRGHIAQDCVSTAPSVGLQQQEDANAQMTQVDKAKMDSEYLSLMAELGEGPPPEQNSGSNSNNERMRNPWVASANNTSVKPPPLMGTDPFGSGSGGYSGQNNRGGGNRPPWMRGGQRGGRGGNYRGGQNRGGNYNNRGQNDYQQQQNNYGGYGQQDYSQGNQDYSGGNMGWMGGGGQYDNMGWQDPNGMGMMNPPPPPPPGSGPSQPPPPPSGDDNASWQQWGGDGTQGGDTAGADGNNQGGQNNMMGQMGYGNMGWGMWGGNMGVGMGQPPMPPGPGPVPPPPPGSGGDETQKTDENNSQQQWGYGNMGYNMGMGMPFSMPPAPPPPPPSS